MMVMECRRLWGCNLVSCRYSGLWTVACGLWPLGGSGGGINARRSTRNTYTYWYQFSFSLPNFFIISSTRNPFKL
jgi:hypothetical protein